MFAQVPPGVPVTSKAALESAGEQGAHKEAPLRTKWESQSRVGDIVATSCQERCQGSLVGTTAHMGTLYNPALYYIESAQQPVLGALDAPVNKTDRDLPLTLVSWQVWVEQKEQSSYCKELGWKWSRAI